MADLICGAFFFACRSCEYLEVPIRGKTQILTLNDIAFSDTSCRPIIDRTISALSSAFYVTLTFREQKNNQKNVTRTQQQNHDSLLCPVKLWIRIVLRLHTSPFTHPATPVCHYHDLKAPIGLRNKRFTQSSVNFFLRLTCKLKPALHFGYTYTTIGTHSIRSGAAMALFLADEHPHKIMLLGRWSSDAFLVYLRPQVQEWTSGMSTAMLQNESFHTALSSTQQLRNNTRHPLDPVLRHDPRSLLGSQPHSINGPKSPAVQFTNFHLFH